MTAEISDTVGCSLVPFEITVSTPLLPVSQISDPHTPGFWWVDLTLSYFSERTSGIVSEIFFFPFGTLTCNLNLANPRKMVTHLKSIPVQPDPSHCGFDCSTRGDEFPHSTLHYFLMQAQSWWEESWDAEVGGRCDESAGTAYTEQRQPLRSSSLESCLQPGALYASFQ